MTPKLLPCAACGMDPAAYAYTTTIRCGFYPDRPHDFARVRCETCKNPAVFAKNLEVAISKWNAEQTQKVKHDA